MKKIILCFWVCFLSGVLNTFGQSVPFPANRTYGNGLMPGNKSGTDAQSNYNTWKSNFVTPCSNGRYRVRFDDPSQTVSEGIGYGMLLSAYAGDRTLFDGLWMYYKDFRNSHGVMHWKISGCSGVSGQNGATDAEVDAAMALIVAHYQWGSSGSINYSNDAKALIAAIKAWEVESGSQVLKPGDMFGGSNITNPSYFAPGYFRAYGEFTNDASFWNGAAAKCYSVINSNLSRNNAAGGLVSDWCRADGSYSSDASGYYDGGKRYHYDAARTPWRIATDYAWYGNTDAKTYSKKCSDFVRVNLGGSRNVKDGYFQNGSAYGQWHNSTFTGAFACAAIAGENQNHLNDSYTDLRGINDAGSYFNQTLKTLYMFLLTGNFYKPGQVTNPTNVAPTVSISSPSNGSSFTAGVNVTISANAADSDGSVSKVEFFQGTVKLGESSAAPYSYTWTNVPAGNYTLTARATDNAGASTTSSAISISVSNAPVVRGPYNGTRWAIPGKIEAENYDTGGNTIAYRDLSAGNSGNAYRNDDVDIETTTDAGGGYNVGWTAAGEWLEYSVNVVNSGSHDIKVRIATTTTGRSLHLEFNGVNVTGAIALPNTGGWQTWQTVTVPGINLSKGNQYMRIVFDSDGINLNYADISTAATPTPNVAPAVSITSPANNSTSIAGSNVTIAANAADSDGTISKVEFFQGTTKLGEKTSAPYTYTWSNVATGSYTLTARATDNEGATSVSSAVSLTVNAPSNQAPSVSLTSPLNNASYTAGSNITLSANASDADGTITRVEFFQGSVKLGEKTTAPYSFSWTNVAAGSYVITSKATDNSGASTTSSPITITVNAPSNQAPTVSIISPLNNASYTAGATISITANAADSDGSVALVEFYQGTVKLGEKTTSPYTVSWTNAAAGSYSLTAKATDNSGAVATSAIVNITVTSVNNDPSNCNTSAIPEATNFSVRNNWADQNNGSGVSNTADALKITHRAWGNPVLYVIETGKTISVVSGKSYTISFDFLDDANNKVQSVETGFARSVDWSGPVLAQPLVTAPAGYSSSAYSKKSVTFTAASSGSFHLTFAINWQGQPNQIVNTYLKNVSICENTSAAKRVINSSDVAENSGSVSPNPFVDQTLLSISDEGQAKLTITDSMGMVVSETNLVLNGAPVLIGQNLNPGNYFVSVICNNNVYNYKIFKQ